MAILLNLVKSISWRHAIIFSFRPSYSIFVIINNARRYSTFVSGLALALLSDDGSLHLHTLVSKFNSIFRRTPTPTRPFSNDQAYPFMSMIFKSPSLLVLCSTPLAASRLTSLTVSCIFASSTKRGPLFPCSRSVVFRVILFPLSP